MDIIKTGTRGEISTTVTEEKTARHLGSGGISVYATPAMVALMEGAAVAAIDHLLPKEQSSVGVSLNIRHVAATPLGSKVRAVAEVTDVDGRKLVFSVKAWDEIELIGEGTHTRFIVDMDRFLQGLEEKK